MGFIIWWDCSVWEFDCRSPGGCNFVISCSLFQRCICGGSWCVFYFKAGTCYRRGFISGGKVPHMMRPLVAVALLLCAVNPTAAQTKTPTCSDGSCDQSGLESVTCSGGSCDQTGCGTATCDGGSCTQNGNTKKATFNGGSCSQCVATAPHRREPPTPPL